MFNHSLSVTKEHNNNQNDVSSNNYANQFTLWPSVLGHHSQPLLSSTLDPKGIFPVYFIFLLFHFSRFGRRYLTYFVNIPMVLTLGLINNVLPHSSSSYYLYFKIPKDKMLSLNKMSMPVYAPVWSRIWWGCRCFCTFICQSHISWYCHLFWKPSWTEVSKFGFHHLP